MLKLVFSFKGGRRCRAFGCARQSSLDGCVSHGVVLSWRSGAAQRSGYGSLERRGCVKASVLQLMLSFNGCRRSLLSWLNGGHEVVRMNRKEWMCFVSLLDNLGPGCACHNKLIGHKSCQADNAKAAGVVSWTDPPQPCRSVNTDTN
jgi:hypothetical protein